MVTVTDSDLNKKEDEASYGDHPTNGHGSLPISLTETEQVREQFIRQKLQREREIQQKQREQLIQQQQLVERQLRLASDTGTSSRRNSVDGSVLAPTAVLDGIYTTENKPRLIVVSNRLPITIKRKSKRSSGNGAGNYEFSMSSGGLVSALVALKKSMDFLWFGWCGFEVPEADKPTIELVLRSDYSALPVYLDDELVDRHYNGFCNEILWPLFHYHPSEVVLNNDNWIAYREANQIFAETIAMHIRDNDLVWVQDYHLMLLPAMLRQLVAPIARNVRLGFFLHTPFPSSEYYRILPVRKEILNGVLGCDLIGFHTYDYARHFLSSCIQILGLRTVPNGVEIDGRMVSVATIPIGIDPDKFTEGLKIPRVVERMATLEKKFQGCKVVVGVDRLDYIKGIPMKLHSFEVFLSQYPEWVGKIVLIQVAVPSRQDVEDYQNLRSVINELVGRINGRFGTVEFTPIHFLHRSMPFEELLALYAISDVCLITSARDGMNLVSFEYVCTQQEKDGVLILSEFTGAAQSLNGSLIVNPYNAEEVANALHTAITMRQELREANQGKLFRYIKKYTSNFWGQSFVSQLQATNPHSMYSTSPSPILSPTTNSTSRVSLELS